ncbi:energy transducer TonB, partial [Sphingomonas astaxanthinifaciens]|uniref:energy transducer TonB n=1 Tax=Sphingomonas astaxanthinifaciens TaxID=407019 RepID=UPI0024E05DB0
LGRGANGSGDGTGGGGNGGSGSGPGGGLGSNARLVSGNLSRGDYRRIRGYGAPRGQAVLALEVGADGRVSRCQPYSTSGTPALDGELCRLLSRTRWEPARDTAGRPVAVALRYVATWDRD